MKPFFNVIKKAKTFEWTIECEEGFLGIKIYLTSLLILKSPQLEDSWYMYLAASKLEISLVLLKLAPDWSQLPVYYVSTTILLAEQSYILPKKCSIGTLNGLKEVVPILSSTLNQCLNQCSSSSYIAQAWVIRTIGKIGRGVK